MLEALQQLENLLKNTNYPLLSSWTHPDIQECINEEMVVIDNNFLMTVDLTEKGRKYLANNNQ